MHHHDCDICAVFGRHKRRYFFIRAGIVSSEVNLHELQD